MSKAAALLRTIEKRRTEIRPVLARFENPNASETVQCAHVMCGRFLSKYDADYAFGLYFCPECPTS